MLQHLLILLHERAILVRHGLAIRALLPGRYTLWKSYDVVRWNTDELTFTAQAAVLAALPLDWYEVVQLAATQRGVIRADWT